MKNTKDTAFTLAEIMIVLTVIGVLTAILLPAAFHTTPDENVMKFKKANSTFASVIKELATSGQYYAVGDLGQKPNGTSVVGQNTYLCRTIAEILNTASVNCTDSNTSGTTGTIVLTVDSSTITSGGGAPPRTGTVTEELKKKNRKILDSACKTNAPAVGEEIKTQDGVVYYSSRPGITFASGFGTGIAAFSPPEQYPANFADEDGFDAAYKILCIDVDGIPAGATSDDCVNECPFGYGVRRDGKIFLGERALEWIEKSAQKE